MRTLCISEDDETDDDLMVDNYRPICSLGKRRLRFCSVPPKTEHLRRSLTRESNESESETISEQNNSFTFETDDPESEILLEQNISSASETDEPPPEMESEKKNNSISQTEINGESAVNSTSFETTEPISFEIVEPVSEVSTQPISDPPISTELFKPVSDSTINPVSKPVSDLEKECNSLLNSLPNSLSNGTEEPNVENETKEPVCSTQIKIEEPVDKADEPVSITDEPVNKTEELVNETTDTHSEAACSLSNFFIENKHIIVAISVIAMTIPIIIHYAKK